MVCKTKPGLLPANVVVLDCVVFKVDENGLLNVVVPENTWKEVALLFVLNGTFVNEPLKSCAFPNICAETWIPVVKPWPGLQVGWTPLLLIL